jgi:hypothetical protein
VETEELRRVEAEQEAVRMKRSEIEERLRLEAEQETERDIQEAKEFHSLKLEGSSKR